LFLLAHATLNAVRTKNVQVLQQQQQQQEGTGTAAALESVVLDSRAWGFVLQEYVYLVLPALPSTSYSSRIIDCLVPSLVALARLAITALLKKGVH
jgi:hypothetical protein